MNGAAQVLMEIIDDALAVKLCEPNCRVPTVLRFSESSLSRRPCIAIMKSFSQVKIGRRSRCASQKSKTNTLRHRNPLCTWSCACAAASSSPPSRRSPQSTTATRPSAGSATHACLRVPPTAARRSAATPTSCAPRRSSSRRVRRVCGRMEDGRDGLGHAGLTSHGSLRDAGMAYVQQVTV